MSSASRITRKRSRADLTEEDTDAIQVSDTPSKRRRSSGRVQSESGTRKQSNGANSFPEDIWEVETSGEEAEVLPEVTPAKRRGRPPKNATPTALANGKVVTPSKPRQRTDPKTPTKSPGASAATPRRKQAADRSARRKSARALIARVVGDDGSDDDDSNRDLVRAIYESSEDDEEESDEDDETEPTSAATTPTQSAQGRRPGRPRKLKQKSPTPPRDLPPHETYFVHNKPGRPKTSNNTLMNLEMLTHEEYFSIANKFKDHHESNVEFLEALHAQSFPQWAFELSQGFSLCLYGFGSKKPLLHKFSGHVYSGIRDHHQHKIVVVNGYVRTTSPREILAMLFSAVDPARKLPAAQPAALVQSLGSMLSASATTLTVVVNSIDAVAVRKTVIQTVFSQIAALPQIRFICSTDTPDFALLWDSGLRSSFNFVFHDCTTFAPLRAELDVVDDVHELLGRKARRVGGKEGVVFVLRSLPENAKNLFRLLVSEVLMAMDEEGAEEHPGLEYRMVYNKAVEEFICSSEMAFRTLLKE
jgi:origin recognition complex subunit 2